MKNCFAVSALAIPFVAAAVLIGWSLGWSLGWLAFGLMVMAWFFLLCWASLRLEELKAPKPFDWNALTDHSLCVHRDHVLMGLCNNCRRGRRAQFVYENPGVPIPNQLLHDTEN